MMIIDIFLLQDGRTAIFYAIQKKYTNVIEVLLQNKASLDIKDMVGNRYS